MKEILIYFILPICIFLWIIIGSKDLEAEYVVDSKVVKKDYKLTYWLLLAYLVISFIPCINLAVLLLWFLKTIFIKEISCTERVFRFKRKNIVGKISYNIISSIYSFFNLMCSTLK